MAGASRALLRNWRLKLSALGLSIFLWALVQTEPLSQETFSSVPVRIDVADTAWTVSGTPTPASVQLRLGGPAREIIRLAREGTRIRVPVASVGSRDTIIALQRDWVELGDGAGVTVESISPATLGVSFEPAVVRSIPLSIRTRGQLPSDVAFSSPLAIQPVSVTVRGPESRLAGLDSVPLEPFDLGRVRESDIFTVPVDMSALGRSTVVPPDATLAVRVDPLLERVLEGIVVHADVRPGEDRVVVDPASVRLRLSGARTIVTAMDLSVVRVSVSPDDVGGMQPGEVRLVRLEVTGVPPLVTATPAVQAVTVRRAADSRTDPSANRP